MNLGTNLARIWRNYRSGTRRRQTTIASVVTGALALLFLTAGAVALTYDSGTCDVEVPTNATSKTCDTAGNHLNNGTIVSYIGDNDVSLGSSGTGIFDSFVRIQGDPSESGYNTDAKKLQFDTKAGNWTHSILVSGIPVVTEGGQQYWELFVDINDNNTTPKIVLTDVEVWFTLNPAITGYVVPTGFSSGATRIYDFSGTILINDVNQGSGRGDLRYLIPLSGITEIPTNCAYGSATCDTYFVLYSQWGDADPTDTYTSDGGFEEWKVKIYPVAATQVKNTNGTVGTGDDTNIADGSSVAIGTGVYDTATLTNTTSTTDDGTLSYYNQKQTTATPDCSAGTLIGSAVTVASGVVPVSATVTLTSAGTYEFWAVYTTDLGVTTTSPCGSETVVVRRNEPAPHSTPVVKIQDTLNVTAFTADATGNVLVGLYSNATCTTRVTGTSDESFAVGGGTFSTTFTVVTAGDYFYKISYAGDSNNAPFSSCVEKVGVTIISVP